MDPNLRAKERGLRGTQPWQTLTIAYGVGHGLDYFFQNNRGGGICIFFLKRRGLKILYWGKGRVGGVS